MEILNIKNLSFTYPNEESKAVAGVSLTVGSGDFIVVCGKSGCGKTTLLRLIKKELAPNGKTEGEIYYMGKSIAEIPKEVSAGEIGFVMQNPENQTVTDKVWHELAFGLESLGVSSNEIRRRVGEIAGFFGIDSWFRKKTTDLSGGQKQLLNLASVMVMNPKILILDEPTSQLDPIGAAEFIAALKKINRELGVTVILAEHRLEEVFPIADKVLFMDKGGVLAYCEPQYAWNELSVNGGEDMLCALPSAVRIFGGIDGKGVCPLTVREGAKYLSENVSNKIKNLDITETAPTGENAVFMKDVWFRYERSSPDVLTDLSLEVKRGEILAILGGNGSGKSTLLKVMSGQRRAYRGKVEINEKNIRTYKETELYRNNVALLPQNPSDLFLKTTVEEDLNEVCKSLGKDKSEIEVYAKKLGIEKLLKRHPYDLSGGEQQKTALCKILLSEPKILLLDEPTKGIDAFAKLSLCRMMQELKAQGITIVLVTHDVEFAAVCADRCGLFFDGSIVSYDTPRKFFSENLFYTTAASRISRHMFDNAVTCDDVVEICKLNGVK